MRKSRSRGNVEGNFTRASALGEILLRPGESEIVWGNLRSMRQNFELKNCGAIVPQKTVPRSSTLWKDSRLPERGKKKKKQVESGGKTSAKVGCSAAATDVLPACTKGQRRPRHEDAPKYSFSHRERWEEAGGGLWNAIVKFTLHYKSKSSLNPNRAILLVQSLKIVPRALHYNYNISNLWLRVPRAQKIPFVPW